MKEEKQIILFDGVCNFCNGAVNFIIKRDTKKIFLFAPLQSIAGQQLLEKYHLNNKNFNSFILIQNGVVFQKTTAVLKVLSLLSPIWKVSALLWIVPRVIRDGGYDVIAKNRYRWFGKKEACIIPSPELKSRFLD
ncbi:MAG: thiol-disulfide oxidoreductase DCC family protein [Chitinophagaceae bacterium]